MAVDAFIAERSAAWAELQSLLAPARRPARLGADGARRLAALYRSAAADLAYARRAFRGDPVIDRLEALVRNARAVLYEHERPLHGVIAFVSRGYWRRVRERPGLLALAALLLLGSGLLSGLWAWRDPVRAQNFAPSQFQAVTEPRSSTDLGLDSSEQARVSSQILTNNIQVTLFAYAGGVALGAGTVWLLLYNGLLLGTVGGLAIGAGNARPFFALVTAHGVLELSCIIVAGVAGLRLGWSIVDPGYRPRGTVVAEEARASIEMVLGTAPWLVVAGLTEGFITPRGLGLGVVLPVGFGLGALFWGLVLWRGAPERVADSDQSRPLALARMYARTQASLNA